MSTEKKKRHSPVRVVKNLRFMLKYAFKYTPSYPFITLCEAFGRAAWHIIGILFTKYVFDAIEAGVKFQTVLFWILLVAGYNAVFELFNKWRLEVYLPKIQLALHEGVQGELYQKARALDQACYDDPEFYNDFIWAIRQSDSRVSYVMGHMELLLNRLVSSVVILGVLISIDVIVAIVLLVSIALSFVIKNKLNQLRYNKELEMNPTQDRDRLRRTADQHRTGGARHGAPGHGETHGHARFPSRSPAPASAEAASGAVAAPALTIVTDRCILYETHGVLRADVGRG